MKKKTITKFITLALVGVMTLGMLAGCGDSGKESSSTPSSSQEQSSKEESSQASSEEENVPTLDKNDPNATAATNGLKLPEIPDGVLKLEVSIPEYNQSAEGTMIQEEWQKRMENYLGVKLDINWTRSDQGGYRSQEMVILETGMIPDVATLTKGSAVNEYGEQGMLLNLSDYMDYMVYYPDYMEQTNGGVAFAKNEDGSMYYFMDGFYNPNDIEGAQSFTAFAYRFDVLRDNGWNPPTTLDEFTELCANVQAGIDAGTIDADYVIMNSNKSYSLYRGFVGIFHTWDCLYYNGEEWVFGPIEDNFREMLKYLNSLYNAGYLDPEFATANGDSCNTKATNGQAIICPTLWAGSVASWNSAVVDPGMEWGLAFLPEDSKYGRPWKWGSRQAGKSLSDANGIYISADVEYPEYVVAMIDYQYSDAMVELLNWGIEGTTYNVVDGEKVFIDGIMNAESPAIESANYCLMSSSVCRSGIPFTPLDFNAMLDLSSLPEPWWNETKGYYEGKYWEETSYNGGPDSVSPYDRPPVTYLTGEESSAKAQMGYGGACDTRVKELAYQFTVGELDINDDAAWANYIKDVKSQTDGDFDEIIQMLNEKTVK